MSSNSSAQASSGSLKSGDEFKAQALNDYSTCYLSRQASLVGRKEVLSGKAKFGIFGDGKEVAQVAMARAFQSGDWRSGYYRDQTFMFALGSCSLQQFFAQLYAHPDIEADPFSGGRQMNAHFSSRYIDEQGGWRDQLQSFNCSSDISPTAGQMSRALGLAYASKMYRQLPEQVGKGFSDQGKEVSFCTIGNASTSEGVFWETMNAACVLQVPLVVSVWDDEYGISVPKEFHTVKHSISKALQGFQRGQSKDSSQQGLEMVEVKGWDYPALLKAYRDAVELARTQHVPVLFHVTELTQPQGHSTSGSHERYKSTERLAHERDLDGLSRMRAWLLQEGITTEDVLTGLEKACEAEVEAARKAAWEAYQTPIRALRDRAMESLADLEAALKATPKASPEPEPAQEVAKLVSRLKGTRTVYRRDVHAALRRALFLGIGEKQQAAWQKVQGLEQTLRKDHSQLFNTHLHSEHKSAVDVSAIDPVYSEDAERVDGRQIIQRYFDQLLQRNQRVFALGEDIGQLGGVNLEFEGLGAKHGTHRVSDTSIREATIFGQGMGAAMRGLRPIADIQYLDYLLYCLQGMSDDLATLNYRTAGGQVAPLIVRTKGHRLEGIWHTGSPMGMILGSLRGVHVCVPRNMVQAAGMYATLLEGDDPGLVIEVLNGYRLKERVPSNLGDYRVPLGVPEVLRQGDDLTLITYGACLRVALEAADLLASMGVSIEVIDVQTLLPFDRVQVIQSSLQKTHALLALDEDVAGSASAYMLEQVLVRGGGYDYLDAAPQTLSAKDHRAAYSSDGDYYSKPNAEDVVTRVWSMMRDRDPKRFPDL